MAEQKQTGRLTQPEVDVRAPQNSRAGRHDWEADDVQIVEEGEDAGKSPKK